MQITRVLTSATLDALSGKPLGIVPDIMGDGSPVKITYESVCIQSRTSTANVTNNPPQEEIVIGEDVHVERSPMKIRCYVTSDNAAGADIVGYPESVDSLDAESDNTDVSYAMPGAKITLNTFGALGTNGFTSHRFTFEPA